MSKIRRLSTRRGDPVDVPPSAREVKAHYSEPPTDAEVEQIRAFIRERQAPYLYPGHTHTRPPKNVAVKYVGEFELTEETAAPCPCCSPDHAKYWRSGRIAWFPDERVIRLMGWQCFETLSPDAHREAQEEYDREQERKHDEQFILTNLDKVQIAIDAVNRNKPIAEALDRFTEQLHGIIYDTHGMKLLHHVRDGVLQVAEGRGFLRRYGRIDGYLILREPRKSAVEHLARALEILESLDERVRMGQLEALTDTERTAACDTISKGVAEARAAVDSIRDLRHFVGVTTASTLRNWGRHRGCPCDVYARRDGPFFRIGKTEDESGSIFLPTVLEDSLAPIAELGDAPRRRRRQQSARKRSNAA